MRLGYAKGEDENILVNSISWPKRYFNSIPSSSYSTDYCVINIGNPDLNSIATKEQYLTSFDYCVLQKLFARYVNISILVVRR